MDCVRQLGYFTHENMFTDDFVQAPSVCAYCKQSSEDPNLTLFDGDADEALEEASLLTDATFILVNDSEKHDQRDLRAKHKIEYFSIYDGNGHLCRIDDGLIEQDVELYMSGYVKPIYNDSLRLEGGKWGKKIGPINEWWISEFDGGKNVLIGVTTDLAEYVLLHPRLAYSELWKFACEKANLSKVLIESLVEDRSMTLSGLVKEMATFFHTKCSVSEDVAASLARKSMKRYGNFLISQVVSYDNHRSAGDLLISRHPCFVKFQRMVSKGKRAPRILPLEQTDPKPVPRKRKSSVESNADDESVKVAQVKKRRKKSADLKRRRRCGACAACLRVNCGLCRNCVKMVEFGGEGLSKQACMLRKCEDME